MADIKKMTNFDDVATKKGQSTTGQYKDSLFKHIFNDEQRFLELYNAISDKPYPESAKVELYSNHPLLAKYNLRTFVLASIPEWFADFPFLVKAGAVLDYVDSCKNAAIKYKQTGEVSEIGFRSKKSRTQSCVIKPESVTKLLSSYNR